MDPGYITLLSAVAVGVAYGIYHSRRPQKKGPGGWAALVVLVVLVSGLIIAANLGNEALTWLFGLALMAAVPIMFFLAIGSAIGSLFGRGKAERKRKH